MDNWLNCPPSAALRDSCANILTNLEGKNNHGHCVEQKIFCYIIHLTIINRVIKYIYIYLELSPVIGLQLMLILVIDQSVIKILANSFSTD